MMVWRLDSVSSGVAEAFRGASPVARRQAALVACERAVSATGLEGAFVDGALLALRGTVGGTDATRITLQELAARLDDDYLQVDADGDESRKAEALRCFSKARAASALAFGLSPDSGSLHEAIYEAIAALEDPAELLRVVGDALR